MFENVKQVIVHSHVHTKDYSIYNLYIFYEDVVVVVNLLIWFVFTNQPFPCSKISQLLRLFQLGQFCLVTAAH